MQQNQATETSQPGVERGYRAGLDDGADIGPSGALTWASIVGGQSSSDWSFCGSSATIFRLTALVSCRFAKFA